MSESNSVKGRPPEQTKPGVRVTKVSVKKLFGMFDHEIPLNSTERVTIIHGPNGFGKTVILRMIAALARGSTAIFEHTPFTEFCLELEDGTARIVRRHIEGDKERPLVKFSIRDASGAAQVIEPFLPANLPRNILRQVDGSIPGPYRLTEEGWWVDNLGNRYQLYEMLERFPRAAAHLPPNLRPKQSPLEAFVDLQVFFIETNRLGAEVPLVQQEDYEDVTYGPPRRERLPLSSRVKQYSDDLVQRIRFVLADYAKNSQESDRTFPERLVRFVRDSGTALAERQILDQMTELEKKRQRLISLGLLDSESGLRDLAEDDVRRAPEALTIYVRDVQQKLNVFDDLAERIGSLMDTVNNRFKYKQLKINRQSGFQAISHLGQGIELEDLSSGEQHELVVLYELLFRAPKNALVLVDEPEISLHVAWQSRFLLDLIDILRVTDAYAIVATHSPTIIGSRWDLTTELKGPNGASEASG
jgi:predicted ATP-binding protein involved in virulence